MWQGREITGETNWGCSVCSLLKNRGVTVWSDSLIFDPPMSPATTKRPLQTKTLSKTTNLAWLLGAKSFFWSLGIPPYPEGGVGFMGLIMHPHTWLCMSFYCIGIILKHKLCRMMYLAILVLHSNWCDVSIEYATLNCIFSPVPWPSYIIDGKCCSGFCEQQLHWLEHH